MEKKHLVAVVGITAIVLFFAVSVFALSAQPNKYNGDSQNIAPTGKEVVVKLTMNGYDYAFEPSSVNVGDTVKLVADTSKVRGCYSSFVMPDMGIRKTFRSGDSTYTFVASKAGTFAVTCGMGMAGGQFIVKDSTGNAPIITAQATGSGSKGGSCSSGGGGCGCGGI